MKSKIIIRTLSTLMLILIMLNPGFANQGLNEKDKYARVKDYVNNRVCYPECDGEEMVNGIVLVEYSIKYDGSLNVSGINSSNQLLKDYVLKQFSKIEIKDTSFAEDTSFICKYDANIEVMAELTSIKSSVAFLQKHKDEVDLIFQDIQLTDGLSFDIFKQLEIHNPVIFTTAFNEHAIEAFKVNSIDYLLKPISFDDLSRSIDKMLHMKKHLPGNKKQAIPLDTLMQALGTEQKNYKSRFLAKMGEHIKSVSAESIALFYAEGRTVFMLTNTKRKFIIDHKLEELDELVDPKTFYRVSRSFIVNIHYIEDVVVYSNSRLKIRLTIETDKEIIVSREKVSDFKKWFSGAV